MPLWVSEDFRVTSHSTCFIQDWPEVAGGLAQCRAKFSLGQLGEAGKFLYAESGKGYSLTGEAAHQTSLACCSLATVPGPVAAKPLFRYPFHPKVLMSVLATDLFFCPTQEHQALLVKVREGEMALEELRIKNADCQTEREK